MLTQKFIDRVTTARDERQKRMFYANDREKEIMTCPFCGGMMLLHFNSMLYNGISYGKSYICENYPKCNTYVGCHKGTTVPLGTPADAELRLLRRKCHKVFDEKWKSGRMTRKEAYKYLAEIMEFVVSDKGAPLRESILKVYNNA